MVMKDRICVLILLFPPMHFFLSSKVKDNYPVKFEVFTAVTMKNGVFLQKPHGVTSQKRPCNNYPIPKT
jgi:hypothetical protein